MNIFDDNIKQCSTDEGCKEINNYLSTSDKKIEAKIAINKELQDEVIKRIRIREDKKKKLTVSIAKLSDELEKIVEEITILLDKY